MKRGICFSSATLLAYRSGCVPPRVVFTLGLVIAFAAMANPMSCWHGVHAYFGSCSLNAFLVSFNVSM